MEALSVSLDNEPTSTSVEVNWILNNVFPSKIEYQPAYSHRDVNDWETDPWIAIKEMKYNFTNLSPFTR